MASSHRRTNLPSEVSPSGDRRSYPPVVTIPALFGAGGSVIARIWRAPAVAAEPHNHMMRLLLARAYFHSAQLHKAEQQFRGLLELDPTDDYAHLALGRTLQRQSRPAEAAGCYRVAYALRPDPEYAEALDRLEHR